MWGDNMTTVIVGIISATAAILASSGFWAHFTRRMERNDADSMLIMGLAYIRLIDLCTKYINRGFIAHEELRDLHKYLYDPYKAKGGNGTIEAMMEKVDNLPIKSVTDIFNSRQSAEHMDFIKTELTKREFKNE